MKPKVPDLEGGSPVWLPESFLLKVEVTGEIRLPEVVREGLGHALYLYPAVREPRIL